MTEEEWTEKGAEYATELFENFEKRFKALVWPSRDVDFCVAVATLVAMHIASSNICASSDSHSELLDRIKIFNDAVRRHCCERFVNMKDQA